MSQQRRAGSTLADVNEERDANGDNASHAVVPSTPPVMWPDEGSGFEADPFSPAGMSQQIWTATGYRSRSPLVRRMVQAVALLIALAFIAAQVAH
jgi:hypothetical protein